MMLEILAATEWGEMQKYGIENDKTAREAEDT